MLHVQRSRPEPRDTKSTTFIICSPNLSCPFCPSPRISLVTPVVLFSVPHFFPLSLHCPSPQKRGNGSVVVPLTTAIAATVVPLRSWLFRFSYNILRSLQETGSQLLQEAQSVHGPVRLGTRKAGIRGAEIMNTGYRPHVA